MLPNLRYHITKFTLIRIKHFSQNAPDYSPPSAGSYCYSHRPQDCLTVTYASKLVIILFYYYFQKYKMTLNMSLVRNCKCKIDTEDVVMAAG